MSIKNIFRYYVDRGDKAVIEEPAFKNMLYTMLSYEDKVVVDTNKLTAFNIARAAAISMPYNAAMRQIYLVDTEGSAADMPDRYELSLTGPEKDDHYLRTLLYIDMNGSDSDNMINAVSRKIYQGLTLCFGDRDEEFVLFERSASQQRQNILVMINKRYYGEGDEVTPLKERIRCGLNDTDEGFRVIASKYAAYRALMLTSGTCINTRVNGKDLLNENSVLVVDDFTIKKWNDLCERYGRKQRDSAEVAQATVDVKLDGERLILSTPTSKKKYKVEGEKLFDGEGLISDELSSYISEALKSEREDEVRQYNSFQVRMPFVKGVLHRVDFHRIFEEMFGTDSSNISIKDFYENEHKLSDVKIILTLSMFKMYKNYQKIEKVSEKNGWTVYWDAFRKHDHCLLVSNTDEMFDAASEFTIANYQFLSTLEEKTDHADRRAAVVAPSLNALYSVMNSRDSLAVAAVLMDRTTPDDAEESSEDQHLEKNDGQEHERITDAMLVSRCPDLINTAPFRKRLTYDIIAKDMSYGHLIEPGIMRFLSGDLMQMVCFLADKMKINENNEIFGKFLEEAISASCADSTKPNKVYYYAPGQKKTAIIDRNPHLTRNEHVFAEPLPLTEGSYREKYFSHLTGVVMIQVDSHCALQRLGGADFDGDIARLFYDPAYIDAARSCCETDPLIIPSGAGAKDGPYDSEAKISLIERSSGGSNVGKYSNHAFRTSLFAYGARKKEVKSSGKKEEQENTRVKITGVVNEKTALNDLVKLSCLIGLEIDSVKTGVIPKTDKMLYVIEQNPDMFKSGGDDPHRLKYFIDYKNHVKNENKKIGSKEPFKLTPLDSVIGSFSLVENLPYIFSPYRLSVGKNYAAEDWAENCRRVLYRSVEKDEEHIFKPANDKHISKEGVYCSLGSLVPGAEEYRTDVSELFIDAYCALSAHLFFSTRIGNTVENKKFDTIRRLLIQQYDNYEGTIIADKLHQNRECAGNLSQASQMLYGLLGWKNLPTGELRKSRFVSLAKEPDHRIELSPSIIGAFDQHCCRLSTSDPNPDELARLILGEEYAALYSDSNELLYDGKSVASRVIVCILKMYSGDPEIKLDEKLLEDKKYVRMCQEDGFIKKCKAVEALWQQLHTSDIPDEKVSKSERLKRLCGKMFLDPDVDWLAVQDVDKRREMFERLWKMGVKPKKDGRKNFKRPLPDELKDILCEPKNYQLLPAFLDYCRSTAETTVKRRNEREFDRNAQELINSIIGASNGEPKLGGDIQETMRELVSAFVMSVRNKEQDGELKQYITPVRTVSEYQQFITDWLEDPEKYEIKGKWLTFGERAIRLNSAVLYCIIRAVIKSHPGEHISGEAVADIMLRLCHPDAEIRDGQLIPADKKDVLYLLIKYISGSEGGLTPSSSKDKIENFIMQYMREPLYDSLAREKTITRVSGFVPDMRCGFLDGSRCAHIHLTTAEQLKPDGLELGGRSVVITAGSVDGNVEGEDIAEKIKSRIGVQLNGFTDGTTAHVVLGDGEDNYDERLRFMEETLWLYSVPFAVKLQLPSGKTVKAARGVVSRLRLPCDEKGAISAGYEDIAVGEAAVSAVLNSDVTEDNEEKPACFGVNVPLRRFIWGYKKYELKGEQQK